MDISLRQLTIQDGQDIYDMLQEIPKAKYGYGTLLLKLLLDNMKDRGIERVLVTAYNHNTPSIKVALNNGGVIEKITDERIYIWFNNK